MFELCDVLERQGLADGIVARLACILMKQHGISGWKHLLKTLGNAITETIIFKSSLDALALQNLCLWCEFQSRLPFIISLLLKKHFDSPVLTQKTPGVCDLHVCWLLICELYVTLVNKFQSLSLSCLKKVEENNTMFPSIITFPTLLVPPDWLKFNRHYLLINNKNEAEYLMRNYGDQGGCYQSRP